VQARASVLGLDTLAAQKRAELAAAAPKRNTLSFGDDDNGPAPPRARAAAVSPIANRFFGAGRRGGREGGADWFWVRSARAEEGGSAKGAAAAAERLKGIKRGQKRMRRKSGSEQRRASTPAHPVSCPWRAAV
jgi:hypothetical protein